MGQRGDGEEAASVRAGRWWGEVGEAEGQEPGCGKRAGGNAGRLWAAHQHRAAYLTGTLKVEEIKAEGMAEEYTSSAEKKVSQEAFAGKSGSLYGTVRQAQWAQRLNHSRAVRWRRYQRGPKRKMMGWRDASWAHSKWMQSATRSPCWQSRAAG